MERGLEISLHASSYKHRKRSQNSQLYPKSRTKSGTHNQFINSKTSINKNMELYKGHDPVKEFASGGDSFQNNCKWLILRSHRLSLSSKLLGMCNSIILPALGRSQRLSRVGAWMGDPQGRLCRRRLWQNTLVLKVPCWSLCKSVATWQHYLSMIKENNCQVGPMCSQVTGEKLRGQLA